MNPAEPPVPILCKKSWLEEFSDLQERVHRTSPAKREGRRAKGEGKRPSPYYCCSATFPIWQAVTAGSAPPLFCRNFLANNLMVFTLPSQHTAMLDL